MSRDEKLNLIFMRDDSRVRRYRLRVVWIKGFLFIQILLVAAALCGTSAGIYYWQQYDALAIANDELREQLSEQAAHGERLRNIQEILKTSEPQEIQALFNTVTKQRQSLPQAINLQDIFVAKDLERAGVTNIQLQETEDNLRITFDLNNLAEETLSGTIRVFFITQQATVIEAQGGKSELRLEIQGFKRVDSRLRLPDGLELEMIFAIRLVIQDQDAQEVFIQTYPVANIFSQQYLDSSGDNL